MVYLSKNSEIVFIGKFSYIDLRKTKTDGNEIDENGKTWVTKDDFVIEELDNLLEGKEFISWLFDQMRFNNEYVSYKNFSRQHTKF